MPGHGQRRLDGTVAEQPWNSHMYGCTKGLGRSLSSHPYFPVSYQRRPVLCKNGYAHTFWEAACCPPCLLLAVDTGSHSGHCGCRHFNEYHTRQGPNVYGTDLTSQATNMWRDTGTDVQNYSVSTSLTALDREPPTHLIPQLTATRPLPS